MFTFKHFFLLNSKCLALALDFLLAKNSKAEKEAAFLQQNRNSTKSMIGADGEEVASR